MLPDEKSSVFAARELDGGFVVNASSEAVRMEQGDEGQPAASCLGGVHLGRLQKARCNASMTSRTSLRASE
jgi:hypothetical protein